MPREGGKSPIQGPLGCLCGHFWGLARHWRGCEGEGVHRQKGRLQGIGGGSRSWLAGMGLAGHGKTPKKLEARGQIDPPPLEKKVVFGLGPVAQNRYRAQTL